MRARSYVVAGVVGLAFVVMVGLVLVKTGGGGAERTRPEAAPAARETPPAAPETHPTRGTYVPPKPEPTVTTRSPQPVRTSSPKARDGDDRRRGRRVHRDCPRGWSGVPFLRDWCRRHGYRTR